MKEGKGEGVVSLVEGEGEGEQGRVGVGIHRYIVGKQR